MWGERVKRARSVPGPLNLLRTLATNPSDLCLQRTLLHTHRHAWHCSLGSDGSGSLLPRLRQRQRSLGLQDEHCGRTEMVTTCHLLCLYVCQSPLTPSPRFLFSFLLSSQPSFGTSLSYSGERPYVSSGRGGRRQLRRIIWTSARKLHCFHKDLAAFSTPRFVGA